MKLHYYSKPEEIIYHYDSNDPVYIPKEFKSKPVKAVWVSNVVNIDLPHITDETHYKEEIIKMLNTLQEFGINTMYFQVRTTCDAFYESDINPTSRYLVKEEGDTLPFDVMSWIIKEAKIRGIEFHAWCNPYRVSADGKLAQEDYLKTCDDLNFAKQHPSYLVQDKKGKLILNPAILEVKQHIIDSMVELVEKYDVAGIHFDDYFYPYSGFHEDYSDDTEFNERNDKTQSLGDFRRMHVNDVIAGVYKAIKKVDSSLQFGVSPFGIWKNKSSDPKGSNTDSKCSETYYNQFADTVTWMKEGYIDYVVPQIYWEFGHPIAPFADIVDFWVRVAKDSDVALYIGHGAYRMGSNDEFKNPKELVNQLYYANQYDNVSGNVFFTYHNFKEDERHKGVENIKELLTR